jgi:hypothetical protein
MTFFWQLPKYDRDYALLQATVLFLAIVIACIVTDYFAVKRGAQGVIEAQKSILVSCEDGETTIDDNAMIHCWSIQKEVPSSIEK